MKPKKVSRPHPEVIEGAAYFREHRDEIKRTYSGQFVAILDSRVIAADEDYGRLEKLAASACPGRHPYLGWANAYSFEEMLERFRIAPGVDIEKLMREAEDEAATEFIRRLYA
jgi:hypothetical protein